MPRNKTEIEQLADEVPKEIQLTVGSITDQPLDWAVLYLVYHTRLSLADGIKIDTEQDPDWSDIPIEDRAAELEWLSEFIEPNEELRELVADTRYMNNFAWTREGLRTVLDAPNDDIDDAIDRLLRGGWVSQRSTSEYGFEIKYAVLAPTKLGDNVLMGLFDAFTVDPLGVPPGVKPPNL